jgi:hypothetical protein
VSVFASGPGAARFNAFQDNTEILFGIMEALGLDPRLSALPDRPLPWAGAPVR